VVVIDAVVAPVLHEYDTPPVAVRVAVTPEHTAGLLTVGVGIVPVFSHCHSAAGRSSACRSDSYGIRACTDRSKILSRGTITP
jgi:hypothetical protein